MCESVLIFSLTLLKEIFIGYRILSEQFVFFSTWKICHIFLALWFQMKKMLSFNHYSLLIVRGFCLAAFQIFFLSLVFRRLTVMCHGIDFFEFILFRIHSASWLCGFISFINWGSFPSLFLWLFSHPSILSPLLLRLCDTDLRFCYNPTGP